MTQVIKGLAEMMFPMVRFYKNVFVVLKDAELCANWNMRAFNSKNYLKSQYIDREGNQFQIANARIVAGRGPLWGYNLGFNRLIKVDLDFVQMSPMSLDDIKRNIQVSLEEWEGWGQNPNLRKIRNAVKESSSIPVLVLALSDLI